MSAAFKGTVICIPCGAPARLVQVDTKDMLQFLQTKVGGFVETITLMHLGPKEIVLWCDEDGRVKGRPPNLLPCGSNAPAVVGNVVITANDRSPGGSLLGLLPTEDTAWLAWATAHRVPLADVGRG